MKKTLLVLLTLILGSSCQSKKPETKTPPVQQEENTRVEVATATVSMTIEGMVCAMGCAAVIEKKLNATPGISKATVDFPSKNALIEFDDAQINPNGIIDVVKGVGEAYSVSSFSIE
ncbi:MAG: heavy-metal-associated domain-containing protein [Candidatus Arcticimaribacter sp.]